MTANHFLTWIEKDLTSVADFESKMSALNSEAGWKLSNYDHDRAFSRLYTKLIEFLSTSSVYFENYEVFAKLHFSRVGASFSICTPMCSALSSLPDHIKLCEGNTNAKLVSIHISKVKVEYFPVGFDFENDSIFDDENMFNNTNDGEKE